MYRLWWFVVICRACDCRLGVVRNDGCVKCAMLFFKQKTAYEMRISDWSSDVCSSDLSSHRYSECASTISQCRHVRCCAEFSHGCRRSGFAHGSALRRYPRFPPSKSQSARPPKARVRSPQAPAGYPQTSRVDLFRSEEQTSELQSLMRISYAVFCLTQKY